MSHGLIVVSALSLLCAIAGFGGVGPDAVAALARVGFFGCLTLTLVGGALTPWSGRTVQLAR